MKSAQLIAVCVGACLTASAASTNAATVELTDFIVEIDRTNFNGFEGVSFDGIYNQAYATYTEGGIVVTQINRDISAYSPQVSTTFMTPGFQGNHSWYASGGDYGFTSIKLASGADFGRVGFLRGSGFVSDGGGSYMHFGLLKGGVLIQKGVVGPNSYLSSYIGFMGGGFDEIWVNETGYENDIFGDGHPFHPPAQGAGYQTYNGLAIDSIEVGRNATTVPIPEPGTYALLLAGLGIFGALARRKDQRLTGA